MKFLYLLEKIRNPFVKQNGYGRDYHAFNNIKRQNVAPKHRKHLFRSFVGNERHASHKEGEVDKFINQKRYARLN